MFTAAAALRKGAGSPCFWVSPEVEHLYQKASAICAEHPNDAVAAKTAADALFSRQQGEGANFRAFSRGGPPAWRT